ncbi:hypothetical protein IT575_12195 [bacterium]|nr:hypothetical protein [bacterium]
MTSDYNTVEALPGGSNNALELLNLESILAASKELMAREATIEVCGATVHEMSSAQFDEGLLKFGEPLVKLAESAEGISFDLGSLIPLIKEVPGLINWLLSASTDLSETAIKSLPQSRRALILAGVLAWNFVQNVGWRCFFGSAKRAGLAVAAEQAASQTNASSEGSAS